MGKHFDEAVELYEQFRYDLAETAVRKELSVNPQHPGSQAILGLCLAKRQAYTDAVAAMKKAISLAPDLPDFYQGLADIYRWQGELESAKKAIQEAIHLNPQEPHYLYTVALILLAEGEELTPEGIGADRACWQKGLELVRQVRKLNPYEAEYSNLETEFLQKLGELPSEEQPIDLDRIAAIAQTKNGWELIKEGKAIQAHTYFRDALRLQPDLEEARIGLLESLRSKYLIYRVSSVSNNLGKITAIVTAVLILIRLIIDSFLPKALLITHLILPVLVAYLCFSLTAPRSFNCLLRFDAVGKSMVKQQEIIQGALCWVGILLITNWMIFGNKMIV
jgi:tetratricopeptide (TPR) repeat protein